MVSLFNTNLSMCEKAFRLDHVRFVFGGRPKQQNVETLKISTHKAPGGNWMIRNQHQIDYLRPNNHRMSKAINSQSAARKAVQLASLSGLSLE